MNDFATNVDVAWRAASQELAQRTRDRPMRVPFEQFDTDVELEEALWAQGGEAVRPVMGAEWDGRVCDLIGRCWQHRAEERPSMSSIVEELSALKENV